MFDELFLMLNVIVFMDKVFVCSPLSWLFDVTFYAMLFPSEP